MGTWIRWIANYLLKAVLVVVIGTAAAMVCHMICAIFAPVQTEALMQSLRNQSVEEWALNCIFSLFPAIGDALGGLNLLVGKITAKVIDTPLLPLYDITGGMVLSACAGVLSFGYSRWLRPMCDAVTGTANRLIDWFMELFLMMVALLIASFCSLPIQMLYDAAYAISTNELIQTLAVVGVFAAILLAFVLMLKLFGSKEWSGALTDAFGKILLSALAAGLVYLLVVSVLSIQTGGGWMSEGTAMLFIMICPITIPFLFGYMAIKK